MQFDAGSVGAYGSQGERFIFTVRLLGIAVMGAEWGASGLIGWKPSGPDADWPTQTRIVMPMEWHETYGRMDQFWSATPKTHAPPTRAGPFIYQI